jgi:protocatechuate 3,4-dioxygenase beta subunit
MPIKDSALPTRAARDRAGHAQHHHCLVHDLGVLSTAAAARRRALGMIAGAGTLALFGCGGAGDSGSAAADATTATATTDSTTSTPSTGTTTSASASCSVIREETEGPYPADGSNRADGSVANALMLSGIVRSDIRGSIAGATGVAAGVPLTLAIELVNTNSACADLAATIYVRHCDREGRYSLYSAGVIGENYLRGVQVTGSDGTATFTTVFPGCYSGRMPHIHFEIYRDANTARSFTNKLKTSQLALPTDVCSTVYSNASGYSASIANLARISFATDNVFSDGVSAQLATVTGSVASGYAARLVVGIAG